MNKVDVVIPVYDGVEETRACIESVLATIDAAWTRLVLVNDSSPRPEISAYLRDVAATHSHVLLLENEQNRGFVGTANRGMSAEGGHDVVLLNSDVEVAGDWLVRLREAAYHHPSVGSLTPFSNNATIFSFPNLCRDNALLFNLSLSEIDAGFAESASVDDAYVVPTGVGCCMYIRRDCLEVVGLLDEETFGKGYGEENDWCQRAIKAGYKNYHLGNCFVYHKGGVSFRDEQDPRIAVALDVLDQRYPSYHADIQRYIAEDPARQLRTRVLLQLFARQARPKVAFLSHKLGGGAQQHVDELASLYAQEALFLQITPEEDGQSIVMTVFDQGQRLQDALHFQVDAEYDKLLGLLRELGVGHVHFHHTMGLHPRLWVLAEALACSHDLTVHDYYLVNGNPTLTDAEARFVGDNHPEFDAVCAGHYPLPAGVSAESWRANQQLMIESAQRIIFPSRDAANRFARFFDSSRAVVAYHPDFRASQPYPAPTWRYGGEGPLRVLVVGAISREKGADVIESVARAVPGTGLEFHLLGYAYRGLDADVVTHGPYDHREVYGLVEQINPHVIWYPALWPETYSYTLSIALHMGLPVVVPDIGAFAERVRGRDLSVVCAWDTSVEAWANFWAGIATTGQLSAPACGVGPESEQSESFYAGQYLATVPARAGEVRRATLIGLAGNLYANTPELSARERLLGRIWKLSRQPVVARMISMVPFSVQQAIKRRLSAKPMHDIVR
ncbi:MAG: glycosyltransferase [Pseudomonadota bacterium]